jgi:GTP cyclohydrolase I
MNRIVEYYSKRPQVQERLTMQIVQELQRTWNGRCSCVIDAKHLCVNSRGISDIESSTYLNLVENLKNHKRAEIFRLH